jgi:hypothetical protein
LITTHLKRKGGAMLKFKHSGNSGDIIYSLNAIKQVCEVNDTQAVFYLDLNVPLIGIQPGHPVGNVMLNEYMYKNLRPLLLSCDFIADVMVYSGQKIDYDLDRFRHIGLNLCASDIKKWYYYAYPEMTFDIEGPIFEFNNKKEDYILINRTSRYQNGQIDYSIINDYKNQKLFVGVRQEFEVMKKTIPSLEYLEVKDFLELANYIDKSKVFIGNQSMCFAIAEQLQTERVLEICAYSPNVIPVGGEFYDVFNQNGFINALNQIL